MFRKLFILLIITTLLSPQNTIASHPHNEEDPYRNGAQITNDQDREWLLSAPRNHLGEVDETECERYGRYCWNGACVLTLSVTAAGVAVFVLGLLFGWFDDFSNHDI